MAENLFAKGTDWLISQAHEIEKAAAAARAKIVSVESRVKALQTREARITDAKKRASAHSANAKLMTGLETVRKAYDAFAAKYQAGKKQAVDFLRAHGLLKGSGLGELGILPVVVAVPLAIVAVFTAAWIGIQWTAASVHALDLQTAAREKKQAKDEQIERDLAAGTINAAQAAAQHAANQQQFDAETHSAEQFKPQNDPLGVASTVEALVPIGLIVLGIVVAPRLLDAFQHSRSRGYLANLRRRRRYARRYA